jgi:YHS domain-containing protein
MVNKLDDRNCGFTTVHWLGRVTWFLAWLTLVAAAAQTVVGADPRSVWRSDFKSALLEAEQRRVPLLVHFYADWCMPCQRMERDVFTSPQVKEYLGTHFVAVKLNSDNHQDIVQRYGVETLPTDLVIDSFNGKVLVLSANPLDTSRYLSLASKASNKFIEIHAAELKKDDTQDTGSTDSKNDGTSATGTATGETQPTKVGDVELGDPQPVVGLDGYSPVALAKHRKWTRGSARFGWDYKDVMYYLSSREELIEFRNDPESFAPKLLGCDPVILWETDRAVAGDIQFGAFFDGELYLFKTDERRKQFKAQPDKFIRLQHALKIDQIERTAMR